MPLFQLRQSLFVLPWCYFSGCPPKYFTHCPYSGCPPKYFSMLSTIQAVHLSTLHAVPIQAVHLLQDVLQASSCPCSGCLSFVPAVPSLGFPTSKRLSLFRLLLLCNSCPFFRLSSKLQAVSVQAVTFMQQLSLL